MTFAEQYRTNRPDDYSSMNDWAQFLSSVDPHCSVTKTDLGVVVMFSDGSKHLLDPVNQQTTEKPCP